MKPVPAPRPPRTPGRRLLLLTLVLLLPALAGRAAPPKQVVYSVSASEADTETRTFRITVRAEGVTEPTIRFAIPAWTPGWYVIQNFERDIENVRATAGPSNAPRPVETVDARTWQVSTGGASAVTLSYDLRASDRGWGFFRAYLDKTNGFLNGPAALMYVVGGTQAPCSITYRVPAGWRVASANDPVSGNPAATFRAPDYDTLADQPADLGRFLRYDRPVSTSSGTVPVSVVLVGTGAEDETDARAKAFADNVFKIAAAGLRLFNNRAPFPRYVFHLRFGQRQGAIGLEHKNSTVISFNSAALSSPSPGWQSIIAHEFVHAWNVKRVRPAALGPFDYSRPVRVPDLWFAEGVTEYFAPRVLAGAGLLDESGWRNYVARTLADLQNNPARLRVTAEEASLKVWEAGNSDGYGGLSYYDKGMIVGLLLDIEMRARTQNRAGLSDLLVSLLADTEKTGKGFAPGGIETKASALAGADLSAFFQRALRSPDELPLAQTLAQAGLRLRETVRTYPFLGISWEPGRINGGGVRIAEVIPGTAAADAGLKAGDVVVAMNGVPVSAARGAVLPPNTQEGDAILLLVRRNGTGDPQPVSVTVGAREERTIRLLNDPAATTEQRAIRNALIGADDTGLTAAGDAG